MAATPLTPERKAMLHAKSRRWFRASATSGVLAWLLMAAAIMLSSWQLAGLSGLVVILTLAFYGMSLLLDSKRIHDHLAEKVDYLRGDA